jgi:signal transduction histidine kinase
VRYQPYGWTRRHPQIADGLLGLMLLAACAGQFQLGSALEIFRIVAVSAVLALAVTLRRSATMIAFGLVAVVGFAQAMFGFGRSPISALQPTVASLAIVVVLYSLAAYRPRRESVAGLMLCLIGTGIALLAWSSTQHSVTVLLGAAAACATLATAWTLGDSMGYRRSYYASLEERLAAAERARELEGKRAQAVEDAATRLRGIERDLHDGAQVRLAALAMTLGEVKETMTADPAGALDLVSSAHQAAKDTLAELRDLARGIHPAVLDRGLGAALRSLIEGSALPVALEVSLARRPSPAIETIAYFSAAELLANTVKHSAASQITIGARDGGQGIMLTVTDDGTGGAHFAPGGGLAGLRERVRTVDGNISVDSPAGGPTVISIELPEHA